MAGKMIALLMSACPSVRVLLFDGDGCDGFVTNEECRIPHLQCLFRYDATRLGQSEKSCMLLCPREEHTRTLPRKIGGGSTSGSFSPSWSGLFTNSSQLDWQIDVWIERWVVGNISIDTGVDVVYRGVLCCASDWCVV